MGWLSVKGWISVVALPRAAFRVAVSRTRRRPPRLTLGRSPRWSRRQSVERETPNARMASSIVSRFVGIALIISQESHCLTRLTPAAPRFEPHSLRCPLSDGLSRRSCRQLGGNPPGCVQSTRLCSRLVDVARQKRLRANHAPLGERSPEEPTRELLPTHALAPPAFRRLQVSLLHSTGAVANAPRSIPRTLANGKPPSASKTRQQKNGPITVERFHQLAAPSLGFVLPSPWPQAEETFFSHRSCKNIFNAASPLIPDHLMLYRSAPQPRAPQPRHVRLLD